MKKIVLFAALTLTTASTLWADSQGYWQDSYDPYSGYHYYYQDFERPAPTYQSLNPND